MEKNSIGHNIRIARTIAGLSQRELADKLGVTWEMISRYETNKVNALGRIVQIAQILNVPTTFLLGESSKMLNDTQVEFQTQSENLIPFITTPKKSLRKQNRKEIAVYPVSSKKINAKYRNYFAISSSDIDSFDDIEIPKGGVLVFAEASKYKPNDTLLFSQSVRNKIKINLSLYRHIIHTDDVKIHGKLILFEKHFD
ncbi:MAG TPA: helix-turn-helix transcriptional regulator [Candidatus Dojkabacteria bacterium]|nr:helix-turn-helix transcriptional regulator [Candidatus Dojkabacteria bacterium]HQF36177.1 helix-turn-helix transcriptional regulator [Candidatus Dojkabacteria bacterium]